MKPNISKSTLKQITESMNSILQKRNGGANNFSGVHFQLLYSCYLILRELKKDTKVNSLQLEGIEDIDLHSSKIITIDSEYIQLKSSINQMDAGKFWESGVLQNFLDVYKHNPNSRFKLVYNMKIANGNLSDLISREQGKSISRFWTDKLEDYLPNTDFSSFFERVSFEYESVNNLYAQIQTLLFKDWNVNKGTEIQFLNALFYKVLISSKNREIVNKTDITNLFQNIRDAYSKAPINKAIEHNWIVKVSYLNNSNKEFEDYFDGKAARPIHISKGLPARRRNWEKLLLETIPKSDVVVIRSSSGQGKSTLAWQVGHNLESKNTIYQLNTCRIPEEANAVIEFLETRILIGEVPLVIIDGLDSSVSAWTTIAERTHQFNIKFLVTTRQEDWFRFGGDISRINLTPIDISLSGQEAKDIYDQFKRKGRVHQDIETWQPVWEQVMSKGLLIEYTYLLTKGQMIHERLSAQIKYLHNDQSSGAKIEILRIVSVADCLNIKLHTRSLINYIKSEIGFQQDRDIVLSELEREYFLNFDGQYIEGLHPVRSNHLKDLLHNNLAIEESLINLFKIIDRDFKNDFFVNSPLLLTDKGKASFFQELASFLSEGEISDIVLAFDGIMHSEPSRYWQSNKEVYDDAYDSGGIDLFNMVTVPFTQLDTLETLSTINSDIQESVKNLAELKKKLPSYTFENSDIILFANLLKDKFQKRKSPISSYKGLQFLVNWFKELKIPISISFIGNEITIDNLISMDFQEAKELMLYFRFSDSVKYSKFIKKHKRILFSYLKIKTNSLTLYDKEGYIYIEYLLFDKEVGDANELSVARIQEVYAFFPYYKKYCTEAIMLPFPSEEIISVAKQNSIKRLTENSIGNTFESHLNKIWLSTIQKEYLETSVYDWQRKVLEIRKIAINWAKAITTLIDSLLEGNITKRERVSSVIPQFRIQLSDAIAAKRDYPKFKNPHFKPNEALHKVKEIDSWLFSLRNINYQLMNVFLPDKERARNVALFNLKAVYINLNDMQKSFRKIENNTIAYFDSESVCREEEKCFERLYATVQYYISQIPLETKMPVKVARKIIEEWWNHSKNEKLNKLREVVLTIEQNSSYEFILPERLDERESITEATIGVINFDLSDQDEIIKLSLDLSELSSIDIDFYSVIIVNDNLANGGIRFKKDYFETFSKFREGNEDVSIEGITPLPIYVDKDLIASLPGVALSPPSFSNMEREKLCQILVELWKISEHRNRLDKKSKIENEWLKKIEADSTKVIDEVMNVSVLINNEFTQFVSKGLEKDSIYTKDDIVVKLFEVLKMEM